MIDRIKSLALVELGDDSVELVEGDVLVGGGLLADMSAVHHLEQVIIVDGVLDPLGDGLELLKFEHAVLVGVVDGEDLLAAVLGLGLANSGADGIEELFEGDGSVLVLECVDHVEDEGVPLVGSQFLQDLGDFTGIDGSAVVLVENGEGLLQLVVVLLGDSVLPSGGFAGSGCGGLGLRSAHGSDLNNKNQYA